MLDEDVHRLLDGMYVVEPGTLAPLSTADGERYLRALPYNIAGTYCWAVASSVPSLGS